MDMLGSVVIVLTALWMAEFGDLSPLAQICHLECQAEVTGFHMTNTRHFIFKRTIRMPFIFLCGNCY